MPTELSDFVNVSQKASDLGFRHPEQLALLPINLEAASAISDLLLASEAATIKKLFLEKGLPVDEILDRDLRPPYVKNKSHEWIAPVLFISGSFYLQDPTMVSLALNVLGNYATRFFMGDSREGEVSLDIIFEKKRNRIYKKISYKGPASGLANLADTIREVAGE